MPAPVHMPTLSSLTGTVQTGVTTPAPLLRNVVSSMCFPLVMSIVVVTAAFEVLVASLAKTLRPHVPSHAPFPVSLCNHRKSWIPPPRSKVRSQTRSNGNTSDPEIISGRSRS